MTLPIVSEIPIENRMEFGIDGTRATRAFTVIAPAPHIALTRLYQVENIRRGTVYRDLQGNAPNANLRCRSLTPSPWVPLAGTVAGALMAALAGWWSLRGVLQRPVSETLRQAAAD